MQKFLLGGAVMLCACLGCPARAGELDIAASSMNALGLELLARAKPEENALISPYSIQSALAMTYAGAAGATKDEMTTVLHYPADEKAVHDSYAAFLGEMTGIREKTLKLVVHDQEHEGPLDPVEIEIASRLFGQRGYVIKPEFLALVKDKYAAPFQLLDFKRNPRLAIEEINRWVAAQTHQHISEILPEEAANGDTRLLLINAVYLKAPWAVAFDKYGTRAEPFYVRGREPEEVRTMQRKGLYGYARGKDFSVITIRYLGNDLQLLIILPDEKDGLTRLENSLTTKFLTECSNPEPDDFILFLPKFKIEPALVSLGLALQSLGLKQAFDQPEGAANFERISPRKGDDYLYLSGVFHKTFLSVDEVGTEAAAVTAIPLAAFGLSTTGPRIRPTVIKVDHPFIFAVQHRMSGACLFLGRVVDPR